MKMKKTLKFFSSFLLCSLLFVICSLGCEQPFKAGLGPMVDLQAPEIRLTSPVSGDYIRGTVKFMGWASDDTQLSSVWFQISNYQNIILEGYETYNHRLGTFYKPKDIRGDIRKWNWSFDIDTKMLVKDENGDFVRAFLEGANFKIRMLAIDHIGRENADVVSEYAFVIKNEGPQIDVDNPVIKKGKGPGDAGGDPLNFGMLSGKKVKDKDNNEINPWETPYGRVIYKKEKIYGTIKDDEGINYNDEGWRMADRDGVKKSVEVFLPQIRFWEVHPSNTIWGVTASGWSGNDSDTGDYVTNDETGEQTWTYYKGYFPSITEVEWVNFFDLDPKLGKLTPQGGDKSAIFEFGPMEETGKYYGFEVRAQSVDKARSGIRYPASYYTYLDGGDYYSYVDADLQFQGPPAATLTNGNGEKPYDINHRENSYVLFMVDERQQAITLELYGLFNYGATPWSEVTQWSDNLSKAPPTGMGLQNIYDPYYEGSALLGYKPLKIDSQDISDRNHLIVDTINVTKGGPFTLRMKATYNAGIKSAEIYWEKDDNRDIRGRFIWDPADDIPAWVVPKPEWDTKAFVGRTEHYTEWGIKGPKNNPAVRSFSFTYHDDPAKLWPDGDRLGSGYGVVSGKSKVQRYPRGSAYDYDEVGDAYDFNTLEGKKPGSDRENDWIDYRLDAGKYNVKVYATGIGGAQAGPFELTISIDKTPPEIILIDIDGKAEDIVFKEDKKEPLLNPVTVNGVIRPRFQFNDSEATDTGFRNGTIGYFKRPGTGYYPEQAFIVIAEGQKAQMEAYLARPDIKGWPEFPDVAPGAADLSSITGVTVLQHGPIDTSSCRILTSSNYEPYGEPAPVIPEGNYTTLGDGTYRVYVFARDNAFRANSISFPIEVKFKTDNPELLWDDDNPLDPKLDPAPAHLPNGVKDPNPSFDRLPDRSGFILPDGNVHNKFNDNTYIKISMKDDDSLDLGIQGGKDSGMKVFISPTTTSYNKATDIITITEDSQLKVPDSAIKEAFAPQTVTSTGEIIPVKEKTGAITQAMLVKGLQSGGGYAGYTNTLPDGIYKVKIDIQDEQRAKLVMPDKDPARDARVKTDSAEFWIAVDRKDPEIDIKWFDPDDPATAGFTRPSGSSLLTDGGENPLVGTVSDENGPITLSNWWVTDGRGRIVSDMENKNKLGLTVLPPIVEVHVLKDADWDGTKLTYEFRYKIDMRESKEDTYTFSLEFKDRFGGTSTVSVAYTADDEAPVVTLTKLIDTFQRDFPDVYLGDPSAISGWQFMEPADVIGDTRFNKYTQLNPTDTDYVRINKERLAVKVVTFSVNAVDNSGKVAGIHWWLLPANVSATATGLATEIASPWGQVKDYYAFPAKAVTNPSIPGTYYSSEAGLGILGFDKGAYGVVDVKYGKFTIAVDSEKMRPENGEYRLHIIAIDEAGNQSKKVETPVSNMFQDVFFLQEEDKPYFDLGITIGTSKSEPEDAIVKNQSDDDLWAKAPAIDGQPVIRGTIWENNGFLSDYTPGAGFWPASSGHPGSISVWFSKNGTAPPSGWETSVENGAALSDTTNWEGPVEIPASLANLLPVGLNKQGRNLYLSVGLKALFPTALDSDGKKRIIIKATDSPVNKYYNDSDAGILMGNTATSGTTPNNESVRVSRWRQYAFTYDAVPPEVKITAPDNGTSYGDNFNDNDGFILKGYILDENLDTIDGNYYIKYYLNNNTSQLNTNIILLGNAVGGLITYIGPGDPGDGTTNLNAKVKFEIPADHLIPASVYKALPDGQHTLNIFAWDKTGKQGGDWVTFTKDTKPPRIAFSNLDSSPYDTTNAAKVPLNWWTLSDADKKPYLLGESSSTFVPLTTLFYDSGVPELRGTITDDVTPVKINVGTYPHVSPDPTADVNSIDPPPSSFRYWLDNEDATTITPTTRYLAEIDGAGEKSVRWTINLSDDGAYAPGLAIPGGGTSTAKPLYDGVHTIVLTAADRGGIEVPYPLGAPGSPLYRIAFRVDSRPPTATAKVYKPGTTEEAESGTVYGNTAYQNDTMFTVQLGAEDANLKAVKVRIVNKSTGDETGDEFLHQNNGEWTYTSNDALLGRDSVIFTKPYDIPRSKFDKSGAYDIIVVAEDHAGNMSEESVWSFIYDKDPPKIVFTNPDDERKTGTAYADLFPEHFIDLNDMEKTEFDASPPLPKRTINRLTSTNLRIQGNVNDEDSSAIWVQSRVERWNWNTGTAGWVQVENWRDVYNVPTNKQNQIAWTKNLLGQNHETETDPLKRDLDLKTTDNPTGEGLYRIRIRAKDRSIITNKHPTDPWDQPNSEGNPVYSDYMYFYFDRNNPELKITNISGVDAEATYFPKPKTGFTFEGTVKDANRFAKVEVEFVLPVKDEENKPITVRKNATMSRYIPPPPATPPDPPDLEPTTINQGGATQSWKAEFQETGGTSFPDGRYTVTVTAYDMTGRYTRTEMKFILDSTPPEAKFNLPTKAPRTLYYGYGHDSENPKPTPTDTAPINNLLDGFASVIVNGGETAVITGETGDKPNKADPGKNLPAGERGSESGVDKMWFRLGFIDGENYSAPLPGGKRFPSKYDIEDDEVRLIMAFYALAPSKVNPLTLLPWPNLTADQVRGIATGTDASGNLTPKERNDWMDKISEYRAGGDTDNRGNAWFRLGGQHKPTGFVIDNPNIYDWRMEIPNKIEKMPSSTPGDPDYDNYLDYVASGIGIGIGPGLNDQIGGLKLYGSRIMVKGRWYEVGPTVARQMVRLVDGQAGVYRLPLWIRLVDKAGNVAYYCHDIWIYPDGDIPSTTIESPSNGSRYSARGGTISVDGVAKSNTSVYDVIFRVFTDGVYDTNLDGVRVSTTPATPVDPYKTIGARRPNTTDIITVTNGGVPYPTVTDAEVLARIPQEYRLAGSWGAGGAYGTAWQRANLTLAGGTGEPLIPWNILLNSNDEIRNTIGDTATGKGFNSSNPSSPTGRDMIRVWMEVFVFNGEGAPIRSSIYPNDNLGTGSQDSTTGASLANNPLYGTANNNPPYYHGGTPPGPRPYVKAFYIKTAAPTIKNPNVGSLDKGGTWRWNTEPPGYRGAGTEKGRRDKFAIRAVLDPNSSTSDISEISYRIKLDGGSYGQWTTAMTRTVQGATVTYTPALGANTNGVIITRVGSTNNYNFEYRIDSKAATAAANAAGYAAINNGAWANSGGTITVSIRMKDNQSPPSEAESAIQVGVDNFAPVADPNIKGNSRVAGSSVDFMGRIYDYATTPAADTMAKDDDYKPKRASKVYAWFMKDGQYVNMNNGTTAASPANGLETIAALENRSATVTYGSANQDIISSLAITRRGGTNSPAFDNLVTRDISVPKRRTTGATPEQAHNADWVREISESTATPGTKMLWSPVNSAVYDIRWSFTLDSTLLPDGNITLCYLVMDDAVLKADPTKPAAVIDGVNNVLTDASGNMLLPGNASYYEQTISVRNKYPQIERITLYTNNDGQGAAYTADAVQEYIINDYRSKMFANYTDPADNQTKPGLPPGISYSNADTTGYLNSGFISKNKYIGFRVETLRGNRPLNFRLQHVTRERMPLTRTNLETWMKAIDDTGNINLYTIAWHGDYSTANWKALGVPTDNPNPTLGTHFILQSSLVDGPTPGSKVLPDDFKVSSTAEVWKYTAATVPETRGDYSPTGQPTIENPVVFGGPNTNFEFNGIAPAATWPAAITNHYGSHPDADDKTPDNPKDTAFFLIRVWDSVTQKTTPPYTTNESWVNDQLYDAVVVGMNVYLTDTTAPTARLYDLNPYTEAAVSRNNIDDDARRATIRDAANPGETVGANIVKGGLYNTGTEREMVRSGYIDPRSKSFALDPKNNDGLPAVVEFPLRVPSDLDPSSTPAPTQDQVSGKVILRGIVQDDQLINEIHVMIGAADKTILRLVNGKMTAVVDGIIGTAPNQQTVAFATETLHWKTGHTVEWAYVWDTEVDPSGRTGGGPGSAKIQVYTTDKNGGNSSDSRGYVNATADTNEGTVTKPFHNEVDVTIVPYITGFERQKPKFDTKRSLQGWYSFYRGEPNITVMGYNLGRTGGTGGTLVYLSQSGALGTSITPAYNTSNPTGVTNAQGRFSFTIPTNAESGKLTVTVYSSGTTYEAYNHKSDNSKSWNKEYNSFTDGSELWLNKPYAHIWRSSEVGAASPRTTIGTVPGNLNHPGMALEYTGGNPGTLHGTWAVYGSANIFYGTNGTTNNFYYLHGSNTALPGEPFSTPDISIYNGGGSDAANVGYTHQPDGRSIILVKSDVTVSSHANEAGQAPPNGFSTNIIQPSTVYGSTPRWQNVRISKAAANVGTTNNNVGLIYMTAYNSDYKSLWYGSRNGTTNSTMIIDGGTTQGINNISAAGAVANAGQYSAVDYDATGPIIAYYDQTNDTVRVALGGNTTPGTGNWTRVYPFPASGPGSELYRGSGKYISIKVDKGGGIHLSFYNSVYNTVVYYYAASRTYITNGTVPNATANVKVFTIDNVVKGGTWTNISVDDNGNPWIVYSNSSRTRNYDGARIAYKSSDKTGVQFTGELHKLNCPVTGADITGWEAVSMPADFTVNEDRLNIEAWPPTNRANPSGTITGGPGWNAAVGYASVDQFRVGYFFYPTFKDDKD